MVLNTSMPASDLTSKDFWFFDSLMMFWNLFCCVVNLWICVVAFWIEWNNDSKKGNLYQTVLPWLKGSWELTEDCRNPLLAGCSVSCRGLLWLFCRGQRKNWEASIPRRSNNNPINTYLDFRCWKQGSSERARLYNYLMLAVVQNCWAKETKAGRRCAAEPVWKDWAQWGGRPWI